MRLDPQVEPKPPIPRALAVNWFICQLATWRTNTTKPAMPGFDGRSKRATSAQLRAPPRLPHFIFVLVGRNVAKATSKGDVAVDEGPRLDIRAPRPRHRQRGSEVQPPPRSSPERPRTREQEPRLTSNRLGFTKFVPHHCQISNFLSTFLAASLVNCHSRKSCHVTAASVIFSRRFSPPLL